MKKLLCLAATLASTATIAISSGANAAYVYVGSWAVADGPLWSGGLVGPSLSGRQAAALIFGGSPTDYAISTDGTDVASINFKAFLDGFGDSQYLTNAQDQDFVGIFGTNYDDGPGNYSAFVFDHACGVFYCDTGGGELAINYAFRLDDGSNPGGVPEPASWAMMIGGFGLVGGVLRRSRKMARTSLA